MTSTSRRHLLIGGVAGGLAAAGTGVASAFPDMRATAATRPLPANPFTLGIASGDPNADGFVIWTRLALKPSSLDAGMPDRSYEVKWQISEREDFSTIKARGTAMARPGNGHAVHVEVSDMSPNREYFYRFKLGKHFSQVGRAVTTPTRANNASALTMGVVSCAHYEHGLFTAYRGLARERPDLIVNLGDYIYERRLRLAFDADPVRRWTGKEADNLRRYRRRYAEYRTDPDLQAAHAVAPWLVTWDDHEVDNNWAGKYPIRGSIEKFAKRRRQAFKAFYENMPLRRSSIPEGTSLALYGRVRWGTLANIHLLDTRQYRDDQACGDGWARDCAEAGLRTRSILGNRQLKWLRKGLSTSETRWDFLANQVFFARRDTDPGDSSRTFMDAWDGYTKNRRRVIKGMADARNPVVLTGDVHAFWAGDVAMDSDNPSAETTAVEVATSSITTSGNGFDVPDGHHPWFDVNPHLKFYSPLRGYTMVNANRETIDIAFRAMPNVSDNNATPFTRRTYTVADRERQLHLASDNPAARAPGKTSKTTRTPQLTDEELIRYTMETESQ